MTDPAVVPEIVAGLRKSFNQGITRPASWRREQLKNFQKMLVEGREVLEKALHADLGKSSAESYFTEINCVENEIMYMLNHLDELMAPRTVGTDILNIPGTSMISPDPLGVVLVLGAWNYPVHLTLLPMAGAIAAGNCVCLKVPSPNYSSNVSRTLGKLVPQYFDRRCFAVVEGDRHAVGAVLKERFDHIFFTGGPSVGRIVAHAAANHLTPITLELGGKSPCIVDSTADIYVSALRIAWGAFMNAGQTCLRPDYIVVHEDVAGALIAQLQKTVERFYSKNQRTSKQFGRLINKGAWKRVTGLIDADKQRIAWGGDRDEDTKYIQPTLIDFGSDHKAFWESEVMGQEIFGPVLPLLRYSDLDHVLEHVNAKEKPLTMYFFSNSKSHQQRIINETSSGSCVINDTIMHMNNHNLPFGGVGNSGMGSYHGHQSFEIFSHMKSTLVKTPYLDIPLRYPPYNPGLKLQVLEAFQTPRSAAFKRFWKFAAVVVVFVLLYSRRASLFALVKPYLKQLFMWLAENLMQD